MAMLNTVHDNDDIPTCSSVDNDSRDSQLNTSYLPWLVEGLSMGGWWPKSVIARAQRGLGYGMRLSRMYGLLRCAVAVEMNLTPIAARARYTSPQGEPRDLGHTVIKSAVSVAIQIRALRPSCSPCGV